MPIDPNLQTTDEAPWLVTQVLAQLDSLAGACNELHRAGREIRFIVPIAPPGAQATDFERPASYVAIFSLPAGPNLG